MPPGAAPAVSTAKYIEKEKIAIRVGDQSTGACYSLIDVFGQGDVRGDTIEEILALKQWAAAPGTVAFHPKWVNRLWNCCQMMHTLSGGTGTVHFLRNAQPTGERYHVAGGVGDCYTFAKCNFGNQGALGAHTINMTGHTLQWLYDEVFAELLRQSG